MTSAMILYMVATASSVHAQLRDPMQPPEFQYSAGDVAQSKYSGYELTSIIIAPGRRVAVINGQSLSKGDSLGNVTVVDIRPAEVLLKRGEEDIVLSLIPVNVKKPVDRQRK
ncbi:MAG: hypothetical protein BMS9Abin26_0392 [Gammaproteobacteria bacterium]|nr:MAG: hypothetical protein BMS9Abin26_0392 [Gammaproteobacteria bacterium]